MQIQKLGLAKTAGRGLPNPKEIAALKAETIDPKLLSDQGTAYAKSPVPPPRSSRSTTDTPQDDFSGSFDPNPALISPKSRRERFPAKDDVLPSPFGHSYGWNDVTVLDDKDEIVRYCRECKCLWSPGFFDFGQCRTCQFCRRELRARDR